jgi:hypothetical protein
MITEVDFFAGYSPDVSIMEIKSRNYYNHAESLLITVDDAQVFAVIVLSLIPLLKTLKMFGTL